MKFYDEDIKKRTQREEKREQGDERKEIKTKGQNTPFSEFSYDGDWQGAPRDLLWIFDEIAPSGPESKTDGTTTKFDHVRLLHVKKKRK